MCFFFLLRRIWSFCLVCPFLSTIMSLSLSLPLPLALSSPLQCICHGNVKNLSCFNSFCALSVEKEGQFCFSSLVSVLRLSGNEDHISSACSYMTGRGWAGLLWENKYYERPNFVIFITLGSMCVLWNRRQCTNTKASLQNAYIQLLKHNAPMLMPYVCANIQPREARICSSRDIHTWTHAVQYCFISHHPTYFLHFGYVCMPVCVCVCACALMFVCLFACICACQRVIECSNDHSPDTGILTAASFHRHIDWHAISYAGVEN